MERSDLRARTILVLSVVALFLWMVRSILVPIVLGGTFALLLHPAHLHLERRLGRFGRLSPFVITLAALVLVVLPLSIIAAQGVASINSFLSNLDRGNVGDIQTSIIHRLHDIAQAFGISITQVRTTVTQMVQRAGTSIAGFLSSLLGSVPEATIDLFLFVLALYFFLRDGRSLGRLLELLSPFSEEETANLHASIAGTVRGAILGTVAVAVVQGSETLIALQIFDVPGAVLFGLIAAFMSLVPVVGTTPVTIGAVVYLAIQDRPGAAIGMFVAALIIGTSDNFVRPFVQSLQGRMHPLMATLGIFGGLAVMGPAGIFIGPVVSALVVWVLRFLATKQRERKIPLVTT